MERICLFIDAVKKTLLAKDYSIFLSAIVFVVFSASSILSYVIYNAHVVSTQRNLAIVASRIDNLLADMFDETNSLTVYIGKQIVQQGTDLNIIARLLKDTAGEQYKTKNMVPWTYFDWVGPNNLQLANSKEGIVRNPPDMSHRSYTRKCRQHPWVLQLSEPGIGVPSGEWLIPTGTGVTNEKGEFLGILSMGYNIAKLTEVMEEKFFGNNASFVILDESLSIVFQSSDNKIIPKNARSQKLLRIAENTFNNSQGVLQNPISHNGIDYYSYRKMKESSYIILTGLHKSLYTKEFQVLVLPIIIELWGIGIFLIVLFYMFRERLIKLGRTSDRAKEEFIIHTNQKLSAPIDTIIQYSQVLLQYLKGDIDVGINQARQIEFLSLIQNAAFNIQNITVDALDLTKVNINKIIKDSIIIHYKVAFQRNISIKMKLDAQFPFLYADEFRIKQIIISLLFSAIEYTPVGGTIKIATALKTVEDQNYLALTIQDDGFGFSEDDIMRMSAKFNESPSQKQYGINLDFGSIIKLIKLHKGTCEIQNKWGIGRTVLVEFPCENLSYKEKYQEVRIRQPS